ncbi:MAG TPA: hypothetical protein VGE65_02575 [Sphingobium sp.]
MDSHPAIGGTPVDDATLNVQASAAPHAYDIRYCPERHYLQMRITGEWDEATFEHFAADYRNAVATLRTHGEISHSLVDASHFGLQAPDIADRFPVLIRSANHCPNQRSACIVPTMVNRIQARAGGDVLNARYFRSIKDAADWLFSDEA